jgi:hypothetical protein
MLQYRDPDRGLGTLKLPVRDPHNRRKEQRLTSSSRRPRHLRYVGFDAEGTYFEIGTLKLPNSTRTTSCQRYGLLNAKKSETQLLYCNEPGRIR